MNRVINFHEVHDTVWFETVILWLKKKYNMISAKDIYAYFYYGKKLKNACLITVDDGHKTSYSTIYPILKKHNVPAIFFVSPFIAQNNNTSLFWFQAVRQIQNTNLFSEIHNNDITIDAIWKKINKKLILNNAQLRYEENMTVEQITEIDKEGLVTIGAHTLTHPFLARETDERSQLEIVNSVSELEKLLGHSVQFFAYPNGTPNVDWGKREIESLKKTDVKISFSTKANNFSHKNNPYAIPRFGLTLGSLRFIKFKLALGSLYPKIKTFISLFKK